MGKKMKLTRVSNTTCTNSIKPQAEVEVIQPVIVITRKKEDLRRDSTCKGNSKLMSRSHLLTPKMGVPKG
jgi:hypothetical protein